MVLLEAMASGLPVIAYKTGSIPEIVGNAGGIVKEGDVLDLSRKMREFTDPQTNREVGTIGIRRARERFDAKKTAEKLAVLYKNMLENHG
jgi:glycosyltransferase involved in cell wall biosynthesis